MNIIVSGGKDFNDWNVFKASLDRLTISWEQVVIFNCCDGECDRMARRYADKRCRCWDFPVSQFVPFPRSYELRNMDIVFNADGAVLFWDGKSPEIGHLISVLKLSRRRTVVFDYYGNIMFNLSF